MIRNTPGFLHKLGCIPVLTYKGSRSSRKPHNHHKSTDDSSVDRHLSKSSLDSRLSRYCNTYPPCQHLLRPPHELRQSTTSNAKAQPPRRQTDVRPPIHSSNTSDQCQPSTPLLTMTVTAAAKNEMPSIPQIRTNTGLLAMSFSGDQIQVSATMGSPVPSAAGQRSDWCGT